MSVDTQKLSKRRKYIRYLNRVAPSRCKGYVNPKALCISINRIPVDETTPLTFRTNIYKETISNICIPNSQQELELLIAKFQFVSNVIRHNLKIISSNGANLMDNLKDTITRPILLNQIRVSAKVIHLNSYSDLKNLLIKALDPNSQEKINNIYSLEDIMNEIKSHPLCNDTILNTLTPIYDKCVKLSIQAVECLQDDTISLDTLFESCLTGNNVK